MGCPHGFRPDCICPAKSFNLSRFYVNTADNAKNGIYELQVLINTQALQLQPAKIVRWNFASGLEMPEAEELAVRKETP